MKELFSKEVAKEYDNLITLIENVHEVIKNRASLKFKKSCGERGYHYYGYELQIRQKLWLFFGTWADTWKITSIPMVISLYDEAKKYNELKEKMKEYHSKNESDIADFGDYFDNHCFSVSVDVLMDERASEKIAGLVIDLIQTIEI